MDATYINVRRDSVAKDPLHVLLGITAEGNRKILDYALYPTESALNYNEDSLDCYVCYYYSDSNHKYANRIQRGFNQVSDELLQMFKPNSQTPNEYPMKEAA